MNVLQTVHDFVIRPVQAQCDFDQEGGVDIGNCFALNENTSVKDVFQDPATMVNIVLTNLFILAGIIFLAMMIFAGFKMIGNAKGKEDAIAILRTAIIGILIMFAAYWVVQILQLVTQVDLLPSGNSQPAVQQPAPGPLDPNGPQ